MYIDGKQSACVYQEWRFFRIYAGVVPLWKERQIMQRLLPLPYFPDKMSVQKVKCARVHYYSAVCLFYKYDNQTYLLFT